jgi:hypothetical protein
MESMRSIDIDFDVHKKIELERTGFEEPPNDALRRLLGLSDTNGRRKSVANTETVASGREWSGKGVTLPHSTALKMDYNGAVYYGVIEDGFWVVEGIRCKSPSDAAGAVARTRGGRSTNLNGWIYWQVKRPTDSKWIMIDALRK